MNDLGNYEPVKLPKKLEEKITLLHLTIGKSHSVQYLTNRFHVAVHLSSNRLQMTSKCGKNKKSGTRGDSGVRH